MDYIQEFVSIIQSLDRSKSIENVFRDFLALSTYSLAQPFYRSKEIEDIYMQIIKSYTREQAVKFSKLLAFLVEGLEQKYQDFLETRTIPHLKCLLIIVFFAFCFNVKKITCCEITHRKKE